MHSLSFRNVICNIRISGDAVWNLASVSAFGVLKMKRWAMRLPVFAGIFHLVFLLLEALPDIVPPDIRGNLPIVIFWVGLDVFTVFYFLRKSVADRFLNNLLTRS